jgi:hypothetical protein
MYQHNHTRTHTLHVLSTSVCLYIALSRLLSRSLSLSFVYFVLKKFSLFTFCCSYFAVTWPEHTKTEFLCMCVLSDSHPFFDAVMRLVLHLWSKLTIATRRAVTWLFKFATAHKSPRRIVVVKLPLTSRYLLHIWMYSTTFRSKSCVLSKKLLSSTIRSISWEKKVSYRTYELGKTVRDFGRHCHRGGWCFPT